MNLLLDIGLPVLVHYLRQNQSGGALGSPMVKSLAHRIDLDGLISDLKAPENQLIDVSFKNVKTLDQRVKEIIKLVDAAAVAPSVHALALKITKGWFDATDLSAAICALASSLRIPCRLRVTGESKDEPTHIFPLLSTDKDNSSAAYVAMDLTLKEPLGYDLSQKGQQVKVKDYDI